MFALYSPVEVFHAQAIEISMIISVDKMFKANKFFQFNHLGLIIAIKTTRCS